MFEWGRRIRQERGGTALGRQSAGGETREKHEVVTAFFEPGVFRAGCLPPFRGTRPADLPVFLRCFFFFFFASCFFGVLRSTASSGAASLRPSVPPAGRRPFPPFPPPGAGRSTLNSGRLRLGTSWVFLFSTRSKIPGKLPEASYSVSVSR